jgi:hypothetical protein
MEGRLAVGQAGSGSPAAERGQPSLPRHAPRPAHVASAVPVDGAELAAHGSVQADRLPPVALQASRHACRQAARQAGAAEGGKKAATAVKAQAEGQARCEGWGTTAAALLLLLPIPQRGCRLAASSSAPQPQATPGQASMSMPLHPAASWNQRLLERSTPFMAPISR